MERLLILIVLITQVIINTKAQNEIKGGPWNTLFGESVDEVIRKLKTTIRVWKCIGILLNTI